MRPSSFCTIATNNTSYELIGLLLSIGVHHPKAKVYVMCDQLTKNEILEITPRPNLQISWFIELDRYSHIDRKEMERQGIFKQFLNNKALIMKYAIQKEKDTLFLDNDIIIVNPIQDIKRGTKLGVSRQYLVKESLEETGYFNAGMLWSCSKNVCDDWIKYTESSRYFEQAAIEQLVNKYSHFEFGEEYNVQCWRQLFNPEKTPFEYFFSSVPNDNVYYKKKPLRCIHTHFRDKRFINFNNLILQHLTKAKMYKTIMIIYRVMRGAWVLKIPSNQHENSFRELAVMFAEKNKDVVIKRTNDLHCWLEPNILLYDRPSLEWCDNQVYNASLFLLGNGSINNEGETVIDKTEVPVLPWIFWPRNPRVVEHYIENHRFPHFHERTIGSIFIGNIENDVQENYRKPLIEHWKRSVDVFECYIGKKHKYTALQYIEKIQMSKYGLCLRGYGSKCHREMELMAVGTVPIVTEDVNTDSYLEPLIEGQHFFKIQTPAELRSIVERTPEFIWRKMSNACIHWYNKNVHSENGWDTMLDNILH